MPPLFWGLFWTGFIYGFVVSYRCYFVILYGLLLLRELGAGSGGRGESCS